MTIQCHFIRKYAKDIIQSVKHRLKLTHYVYRNIEKSTLYEDPDMFRSLKGHFQGFTTIINTNAHKCNIA